MFTDQKESNLAFPTTTIREPCLCTQRDLQHTKRSLHMYTGTHVCVFLKEPCFHFNRALLIHHKSPTNIYRCTCLGVSHDDSNRALFSYQKSPLHMRQEPYIYTKARRVCAFQKESLVSKEPCLHQKSPTNVHGRACLGVSHD